MKTRIALLTILVIGCIFVIAQSLPISRFPNVSTPLDSDLFVLAQTQAPSTNKNIRYDQLRGAIRSGLATETYVNSVSNAAAGAGSNLVVVLTGTNTFVTKTSTNGTNFYTVNGDRTVVLSGTNTHVVNTFTNGTNFYAVNSAGSSETVLWTNSGGIVMLTTNGPVSIASTGLLGGLVVTQDIRFLGHNSASNSVWVCTNATTGEGEWRASTAAAGFGNVATNSDILNIQYEPNRGSTWYSGTNGTPTTNEARAALEFRPFWRSLRMGQVDSGQDIWGGALGFGSNYWNNTNIGVLTVGFGSNALVKGHYSSVLGGSYNGILSNANYSVIGGGYNNFISTNVKTSVISGGGGNAIQSVGNAASDTGNCTIAGGTNNNIFENAAPGGQIFSTISGGANNRIATREATISGGMNNTILFGGAGSFIGGGINNSVDGGAATRETQFSVLVGGSSNFVRGVNAFIGGGQQNNLANQDSDYSVIVGGLSNTISSAGGGNNATHAFIGGGQANFISAGGDFGGILGGLGNTVGGSSSFAIGVSNNASAQHSIAMGRFVTNNLAGSVIMGSFDGTAKVVVGGATNSTVGGLIIGVQTPIASAGASETNLITVTIPAHTLTNTGDRIMFRTSGRFAATADTKQIKAIFGSGTILDTTAQIVNSGAWVIDGEIIRTGATAQSCNASFSGAGVTLFTTAAAVDLVETNGIATVLKITGTVAGDGGITNRSFTAYKWVAP